MESKRDWGNHPPSRVSRSAIAVSAIACCLVGGAIAFEGDPAAAQIVPDGSLGPESSTVAPIDAQRDRIDGGAIRGSNLFHSFREFNVGEGQTVHFTNPAAIDNILTRVTGENLSEINGTLGVLGNANLFLLNPNGIAFGENARLDLNGSFFATTADSIDFPNYQFSAQNPEAPPLLTVSIPIGLQFGSNAGSISVNGGGLQRPPENPDQPIAEAVQAEIDFQRQFLDNRTDGLRVPQNEQIVLIGGNIDLSGGLLVAPSGNIELGAVSGNGTIGLNLTDTNFELDYSNIDRFGNLNFLNESAIVTSREVSGNIRLQGRQVTLTDGSQILATTLTGEPGQTGGKVTIRAIDAVEATGTNSGIVANTFGAGNAGNIEIETSQLMLSDGAFVSTIAQHEGNAGNISVQASEAVEISGVSTVTGLQSSLLASTFGTGNGGNIAIATSRLVLQEGGLILARTLGEGDAGDISVQASEAIEISGASTVSESSSGLLTDTSGLGDAGNIIMTTPQLILRNGGIILAGTQSEGDAGNISAQVSEAIEISGASTISTSPSGLYANTSGIGNAGNITITTPQLILREGGIVSAATLGEGDAGNISVQAFEAIDARGDSTVSELQSSLFASTFGIGNAGNIDIETRRLILREGANVSANTSDDGNAGNISVRASEFIEASGDSKVSGLRSGLSTETFGSGNGGNIDIETPRLILREGASVSAIASREGHAGNISVRASESIESSGISTVFGLRSGLSTETFGIGDGGNIDIETRQLILREGASVSAIASREGNAGNISVRASESIEASGTSTASRLQSGLSTATLRGGNAGNIDIETPQLILREGASVSATALGEGRAGNISVRASELVEVSGKSTIFELSSNLLASTSGAGDAGNITVDTPQLILRDGGSVTVTTSGEGNAGTILIQASELVEAGGELSGLFATTLGTGDAGNITVEAPQLILRDGGSVLATTFGAGNAGTISVRVSEAVKISGISNNFQVSSLSAITSGTGDAGSITVEAPQLILRDGGSVSVSAQSEGNAGTILIQASEAVKISGTSNEAQNESQSSSLSAITSGTGDAGSITVEAPQLILRDGGSVLAGTLGEGNAGTILIQASEAVKISGTSNEAQNESQSSSLSAITSGTGNAGSITVEAPQLILRDGGSVLAGTLGEGNGGTIAVRVSELVEASGVSATDSASGLFASTLDGGNAGNISVETNTLIVRDRAAIGANSDGSGDPGNLNLAVSEVRLDTEGELTATSTTGNGGNIQLRSRDVQLRRQSEISAIGSASAPTFDGNIDIAAETLVLLEGSRIVTSAANPQGGSNINIRPFETGGNAIVLQSPDSTINAQGQLTIEGEITPEPVQLDDVEATDATNLISGGCQDYKDSQFHRVGRGGIPPTPFEPLGSRGVVELDWVEAGEESDRPSSRASLYSNHRDVSPQLVEAGGWYVNDNGDVVLAGSTSEIAPWRLPGCSEIQSSR